MQPDFEEKTYISDDGLRLYYRKYNNINDSKDNNRKTAILCLAGLSRNSKDFHKLASHLQKNGHMVICPDYRGRGKSAFDMNIENYQPAVYLNDIRHLLTLLNIHHINIIGTSLGGILAMAMAATMPTYLKSVILNDIGAKIEPSAISRIISDLSLNRTYDNWEQAINNTKEMFKKNNFANKDDWQELAEASLKKYPDGRIGNDWDINIIKQLQDNSSAPITDLWPLFNGLKNIPTLVIRGEKSDLFSAKTLEEMINIMPDISNITIKDTGHVPSLNEKKAREAIDEFYRTNI